VLLMETVEAQGSALFEDNIDLCQCGFVLRGYAVEDNDIGM